MQSLLFDVSRLDPVTFGLAPAVLGLAAVVASYLPARRAARISPLAALGR
jgi:putative ABC transport system permease protein